MVQVLQTQIACGHEALEKRGLILPVDCRGQTQVADQHPATVIAVWKPELVKEHNREIPWPYLLTEYCVGVITALMRL
jgi:hypothetical protein